MTRVEFWPAFLVLAVTIALAPMAWAQEEEGLGADPAVTESQPADERLDARSLIQPALLPAWDVLLGVQTAEAGSFFLSLQENVSLHIEIGPLPSLQRGLYHANSRKITVNQNLLNEDPRALAAVIAHELTHALQDANQGLSQHSCIADEVQAYGVMAEIWASVWSGPPPARTELEVELNTILATRLREGEPRLYRLVVSDSRYQSLCSLVSPAGPAPTPPATPTPALQNLIGLANEICQTAAEAAQQEEQEVVDYLQRYYSSMASLTPGRVGAAYLEAVQNLRALVDLIGRGCDPILPGSLITRDQITVLTACLQSQDLARRTALQELVRLYEVLRANSSRGVNSFDAFVRSSDALFDRYRLNPRKCGLT